MDSTSNQDIEDEKVDRDIELFIEGVSRVYDYDFTNYAPASLRRRILRAVERYETVSINALREKVENDKIFFSEILSDLTVTVTEMFRDSEYFKYLTQEVIPRLATYPSIRIWHAGCSTGEEVYSMAILLHEAGLLEKSTLYATDINPLAIQNARRGVYSSFEIKKSTKNYLKAGNRGVFSDYYLSDHDSAIMENFLKERIIFSEHSLAVDDVFSEVNLILCRNVFIYFNKELQNRALDLFYRSLCHRGYLCIGSKESLKFTKFDLLFKHLDKSHEIYQKIGPI